MGKHLAPDQPVPARRGGFVRAIALTLGVLLIGAGATLGGIALVTHQNPIKVIFGQIVPSPQEVFGKDHLLVLIVGLDYDYDNKDNEFSKESRSDIIKAVNLDFVTKKAYILSIPRDMDAVLPNGHEAKINQAQSDGGITESKAVISQWLGIPGFDRYVILRIDTMKDLINAIGGVNVNVMNSDALRHQGANGPIDYDDSWGHLHIHLKPGVQHLDGDHAVGYARFRHDWCSDPCRILRQDEVVKAIVTRLKDDKFNTFTHINQLVGVLQHDVETNLTSREELSIANAFSELAPNAIRTDQVPYVDDKQLADYGDVIIPDTTARSRLVRDMLLDPPRPQPSADPVAVMAIAPGDVRVDVQNGTGVPGVAKRVADLLRAKGFTIGQVGNASSEDVATTELHEHTTIVYAATRVRQALGSAAQRARIVSEPLEAPSPSVSPAPVSDVTVIVGQDLAARLGAQQASAVQ